MNTQRDDTIDGATPNEFGINLLMLPMVRICHAALRVRPTSIERLDLGFPSRQRNPRYEEPTDYHLVPPQFVRFTWLNDPGILGALGTSPNARYEDFNLSQRTIEMFGLNVDYPDDATFHCNNREQLGKWVIRIQNPLFTAGVILRYPEQTIAASGATVNEWSVFLKTLDYYVHTNEYSEGRRRNGIRSRRFVQVGPKLHKSRDAYDPTNPMRTCKPDGNTVMWLYHPRLLPGCNSKQFVKLHNQMPSEVLG